MMLQRKAGNGAVRAFVAQSGRGRAPTVQRTPDVAVTGVRLSASKVSVPPSTAPKAKAVPASATGVTFNVEKDTVDPANVTVDQSGSVTVASGQQGGRINVKATSSDGSWATAPLQLVEKPTGIASTSASGADNYGGQFVHTFSAPSGKSSGLEGENINEKFGSLTASTPWDGTFTLAANPAGSHGWDLDGDGMMAGPDNVAIGATGVDVGPFVKSASNPSPKGALPQGFTMTQNLHAKTFPAGTLDTTPFTAVPHKRTLVPGPKFEVEAGAGKVTEDYSGPAAVTKAVATPATLMASPPKPKSGTWAQTKVRVSADMIPLSRAPTFSIRGNALGCSVDASGVVSIGAVAGSVVVRVTASPKNFDEVTITITEYKAPAPIPTTPKSTSTGDEGSNASDLLQGAETGIGGSARPALSATTSPMPPRQYE
jgi:hypothetical protein